MKSSAKILSLVLTLALALTVFAPAAMAKTYITEKSNNFHFSDVKRREAAPAEEPAEAEATETVEQPAEEPTEEPAEAPAAAETNELPANARLMAIVEDELNAERSVSMYAVYDGDTLTFGDKVTLIAVLNGYDNTAYDLQWQSSADDKTWVDVAGETAASYAFTISEANYMNYWRVAVTITGVIVPDDVVAAASAETAANAQ